MELGSVTLKINNQHTQGYPLLYIKDYMRKSAETQALSQGGFCFSGSGRASQPNKVLLECPHEIMYVYARCKVKIHYFLDPK
jgi:hypothetical protein